MAHPHVIAAVDARFRAGFVEPDCPIREVNEKPGADKTRTAFVVLQFPWCRSDPATVGAPGGQWFSEQGTFRFVIALPKGEGLGQGPTWAERIAALFRSEEFEGLWCMAPGSPVIDDRNETDAYFRLSFSVPYEFQFQQPEISP
ncbi:phage tail terminator-like protein [Aureimonas sp. AU12]|uniref:phage tail terminator-like protein n=1 Tax=Aureimonas sp. AU12 TaxID=1638161 RepID=UPI0007844FA7|nr:phage tail terminator-like protein [Aureimonas sp. AU12]